MSANSKELIRGSHNLRPRHHGSVATIGSFDGVHLGHQAIIRQLSAKSHAYQLPSVAVIFEPQPREFFQTNVARLLPLREKVLALFEAGVDKVLCLRFDNEFSALPPEEFVKRVLVDGLGIRYLVVGDDFRFGRDRCGNDQLLAMLAARHHFELASAATVEVDGERVSSTRIRECLAAGDMDEAQKLLGRPFAISGRVIKGQQLGNTLGIPTVNLNLRREVSPVHGTFAATADIGKGKIFQGVANIGMRPTVGDIPKPILEAHLFDFNGDLYGSRVTIEFRKKIRNEMKFPSLEVLVQQIHNDINTAKHFFDKTNF